MEKLAEAMRGSSCLSADSRDDSVRQELVRYIQAEGCEDASGVVDLLFREGLDLNEIEHGISIEDLRVLGITQWKTRRQVMRAFSNLRQAEPDAPSPAHAANAGHSQMSSPRRP